MRTLWQVVFKGYALRLTPSGNRQELYQHAVRQRHHFFDFSDQQLDAFCDYAQQAYELGRPGNEDYTQEQYYQFLELKPGRQPDATRLPYLAANTAGLTYVDFGQFLAGGPLRPAR